MELLKRHYPVIIALFLLYISVVVILDVSINKTGGHFCYALDDIYIHMAVAKNFAKHGVWGVHRYGFTSCTSSLLWTFILAILFSVFGVNDWLPFILNVLLAVTLVIVAYAILYKRIEKRWLILVLLLFLVFFMPLEVMIFTGQEHILQTLSVILFVYYSSNVLISRRNEILVNLLLFILSALVTGSRYEGMALVFVVGLLFALEGMWWGLVSIILGGALPIVVYGIISIIQGWYFLPNSVMLKSKFSTLFHNPIEFIQKVFREIKRVYIPYLITIGLIILVLKTKKGRKLLTISTMPLFIFVLIAIIHITFAQTGALYRYGAYLIALGVLTTGVAGQKYIYKLEKIKDMKTDKFPKYLVVFIFFIWFISPLIIRAGASLSKVSQAVKNIYEQQYQMGLFLKKFYQNTPVAANDIGAINYIADIKCVDLCGLASLDVLKYKIKSEYNTEIIYKLCKREGVKIAILYDKWFEEYGGLPPQWIKVGEWTIQHNVVCGDDKVSFYAVDSTETENLIKNLQEFSKLLPSDVIQSGKYTEKI